MPDLERYSGREMENLVGEVFTVEVRSFGHPDSSFDADSIPL